MPLKDPINTILGRSIVIAFAFAFCYQFPNLCFMCTASIDGEKAGRGRHFRVYFIINSTINSINIESKGMFNI